ncbi:hypothetical protein IPA_09480 [Ignicoccus pacificus DSM 13166]|uniref:Uncharacterized protein n=1 Tax=Ignicoccus pacificus DSM 13166 TaxID=940294 RepID=A0A977PLW4_9CREN|nr:hypothetical protein IPA_09480 [Ignicoccus pacificus DSM 13166]
MTIKVRIYGTQREGILELDEDKIVKVKGFGNRLIIEHELGFRVLGTCKKWAYHVWGMKAYSVLDDCDNEVYLLLKTSTPSLLRDEKGWMLLIFDEVEEAFKPWLPLSLVAKADRSVRGGALLALGEEI